MSAQQRAQMDVSTVEKNIPRPIVTVGGLLFNAQAEALFVRTHKWNHKYGLPGGKVELGETLEQAFHREIREETALEVTDVEFICAQESIFSPEFYKPAHMILLNFQATLKIFGSDYQVPILNEEAQSYVWLSLEEALAELDLNFATKHLVNMLLRRRPVIKAPPQG